MHGLIFETSVWLLAESTRLLSSKILDRFIEIHSTHLNLVLTTKFLHESFQTVFLYKFSKELTYLLTYHSTRSCLEIFTFTQDTRT